VLLFLQSRFLFKGDVEMRWQAVSAALVSVLALGALASASVIDFATDPNLGSWTSANYYNSYNDNASATWNQTDATLDVAMGPCGSVHWYAPSNNSRGDADPVTLTIKSYTDAANSGLGYSDGPYWAGVELIVSSVATPPDYTSLTDLYRFGIRTGSDAGATGAEYILKGAMNQIVGEHAISSVPTNLVLDIVRDGQDYVFKANGAEMFRSHVFGSTSLPYYAVAINASAGDAMTAKLDNFGTVVPEPSTLALVATGLLGLLAYAWRKRR
jgi:hypothetical protein